MARGWETSEEDVSAVGRLGTACGRGRGGQSGNRGIVESWNRGAGETVSKESRERDPAATEWRIRTVSAASSRSSATSSPDHGCVALSWCSREGWLYRPAILPASRGSSESIFPHPRHPLRNLALVFPLQAPAREARAIRPGSEIALLRRYGGYGACMPKA